MALTQEEIAAVCDCSIDTIQRNYKAAWTRGQVMMKASLKRRQFQVAMGGHVTMLIWLGKQHLGQRDNLDLSGDMTHKYLMETPPKAASSDDWHQQFSPQKKNPTMQ